jgi:hypothetical protein
MQAIPTAFPSTECIHGRVARKMSLRWILAGFLLILPSCERTPTTPNEISVIPSFSEQPSFYRPAEQLPLSISRVRPEFAGYYFDEAGDLVVLLTDPSRIDEVAGLVAPILQIARSRRQLGMGPRSLKSQVADFSFADLSRWRDAITMNILDLPGASFVDLDQRRNRIVVGLRDASVNSAAQEILERHSVPLPAVEFQSASANRSLANPASSLALRRTHSLSDRVRPLMGGLEVWYAAGGTVDGYCTLGLVVMQGGVPRGLTNSHCTTQKGVVNNDSFYQDNVLTAAQYIGVEYSDPSGWSCLFGTRTCRYSDAALFTVSAPMDSVLVGTIARTGSAANGWGNSGSTTLNPAHFQMTGALDVGYWTIGLDVDKVGLSTGWTWGYVTSGCVDLNADDGTWRYICQARADFYATDGDSGSPVFAVNESDELVLLGINWSVNDGLERTNFSPVANIIADLGSFSVEPFPLVNLTINGSTGPVSLPYGDSLKYVWNSPDADWCQFITPSGSVTNTSGSGVSTPPYYYYPIYPDQKVWSIRCGRNSTGVEDTASVIVNGQHPPVCTSAASAALDTMGPPHGISMPTSHQFSGQWRIRNTATNCMWDSSITLQYVSNTNGYLSTSQSPRAVTGVIYPDDYYIFQVPMLAPATIGSYREDWRLVDASSNTIQVSGASSVSAQIASTDSVGAIAGYGYAPAYSGSSFRFNMWAQWDYVSVPSSVHFGLSTFSDSGFQWDVWEATPTSGYLSGNHTNVTQQIGDTWITCPVSGEVDEVTHWVWVEWWGLGFYYFIGDEWYDYDVALPGC